MVRRLASALLTATVLVAAPARAAEPWADRRGTGLDALSPFAYEPVPARISDVGVGLVLAGAGGVSLARAQGPLGWRAPVGTGGAVLLTLGATALTKEGVGRRRPYTWDPALAWDPATADPDDSRSFFSGHAATTAASSFALAMTLDQGGDLDTPGQRWAAYGSAAALTLGVGSLRVAAGKHYPSDVAAGAAVGTALGLLVPWLLDRRH